jgi:hypothetical protein
MASPSSNDWHWMQESELDSPIDSESLGEKKIFAIVSRPIPVGPAGKTIRRVVIFDNHPATLKLVMKSRGLLDGT